MRAYMLRRARYILARNTAERALADLICAHIVRACTTSATEIEFYTRSAPPWLIAKLGSASRTLLVAKQLEGACAVRTYFERPGSMSRVRPRSLLAWIHRLDGLVDGAWRARAREMLGENARFGSCLFIHRLAPSYQFSHRDYGLPSQNFEKSSTYPFSPEPPTPPIPSDPRCDATPPTSIAPKSGQK